MQILQSLQDMSPSDQPLARWQAMGLPIPPSWQLSSHALADVASLQAELAQLEQAQHEGHYWVLQQGRMNANSQRQSLISLDSSQALLTALDAHFHSGHETAIVQLLPRRQVAGILFTRHPLRQDLDHLVVEGVSDEAHSAQRLILQADGRLVFRSQLTDALDEKVPVAQLLALANQLKARFDKPQAAEWVFDGKQLWLLQTLPIGSLPDPREAWSCRVQDGFWQQAVTPLWYTLESRWLKNRFWEPLVAKTGWQSLHKVEPYRRQHSHIYRNSQFFRQLSGFNQALPPAWREAQVRQDTPQLKPLGWLTRLLLVLQLRQVEKRLSACLAHSHDNWRRLLELDLLGEELAQVSGNLHYRCPHLLRQNQILPLGVQAWLSGQRNSLRAGLDPIHPFMSMTPPEANTLPLADSRLTSLLQPAPNAAQRLIAHCEALRERLADVLHLCLRALGVELASKGFLPHAEDIHFCYFDELWRLCEQQKLPDSLAGDTLGKRKLRYLEDAHSGAPDWKIDQLGFGFNQDHQSHELLLGKMASAGQVSGKVRRLLSSWVLNQIQPGEVLVLQQCDSHWLPWLSQAAGIILACHDDQDVAVRLAQTLGLPCIYALDDAMHCLADGQRVALDAQAGRVTLLP